MEAAWKISVNLQDGPALSGVGTGWLSATFWGGKATNQHDFSMHCRSSGPLDAELASGEALVTSSRALETRYLDSEPDADPDPDPATWDWVGLGQRRCKAAAAKPKLPCGFPLHGVARLEQLPWTPRSISNATASESATGSFAVSRFLFAVSGVFLPLQWKDGEYVDVLGPMLRNAEGVLVYAQNGADARARHASQRTQMMSDHEILRLE